MTPLITEFSGFLRDRALRYTWFDMSALDKVALESPRENAMPLLQQPLPFEECAVVGKDTEFTKYVFFVKKITVPVANGKEVECFYLRVGYTVETGFIHSPPMTIDISSGDVDKIQVSFDQKYVRDNPNFLNDDELQQDMMTMAITLLCVWLKAINVDTRKAYTPTARPNHAKRVRQGKKPFYDWHVVTIEPPKEAAPHKGGTHASPRLHEVRGHWVNRNGKRFWRKPHQRGDVELGISFHDYKIKGEVHG